MLKNSIKNPLFESVSLPVIAAPMFLVSNPDTVISGCKEGIISTFPSLNARTNEILEEWLVRITTELHKEDAPFAVNLIVHPTNKRYSADLDLIKKYNVPIVISSLGNPSEVISSVHEYGGLVFADVATVYHAKKASEAGVDGLILVCAGAGGHGGLLNPFAFIHEVREFYDGLIILAGSMGSGKDVLAAQVLGADFAYLGTRFIATTESSANEEYRSLLVESSINDIVYTDAFTGVHGNYLIPSIQKAGIDIEKIKKKEIDFSSMKDGENGKAWKDIWSAGQGVGSTKKVQTMQEVVQELKQEYKEARNGLQEVKV